MKCYGKSKGTTPFLHSGKKLSRGEQHRSVGIDVACLAAVLKAQPDFFILSVEVYDKEVA